MSRNKARLEARSRPAVGYRQGHRLAAGAAAMLSLITTPTVGFAQGAAPEGEQKAGHMLEEVMVTARRREESAQTIPVSVTALDGEQIDNLQINNLENLQTVVPELSVSAASGRPNSPVYGLRGIRPTESIYGQDPTVAVYFADFVLSPAQGSNLGIFDLASVQILKGPQGTLFGRNTTGGAILFGPKRPGDSFAGDATVGFGSYGRTEAQLGLDIPAADNLKLRFVGRAVQSDGYQTNKAPGPLFGSKLGGEDTRNLRLSGVWNITDSVENYTVLSWDDKETNGRGMVLQAVNPASSARFYNGAPLPSIFAALARAQGRDVTDVESDIRQYDRTTAYSIINTTSAELNDTLTLKSIAGYRNFETHSTIDLDSTSIPGFLTAGSNSPGVLTAPEQHVKLEHESLELQLLGTALDERLNWVTGLYAYHEEGFEFSPGDVLLALQQAGNPFAQRGDVDNSSYSGFAQGTYNFTPQWALTTGARWTYDKKEMTVSTRNGATCAVSNPVTGAPLPAGSPCAVTLSKSFDQPTGTVSLDFKPTDGVLLYVASRYGYRAGGFNLRAVRPIEYQPFDPETVVDVELGAKTDWSLGNVNMRTNVAVYRQSYDDIQRTVAVTNQFNVPGSTVENAAKAKVLGLELEQTIAPTDNLSLQINYAYTDPKYDDWSETIPNPAVPGTSMQRDLSDTPFHFTPKHSGSAQLTYTVPLEAAGDLRFSASGSYRGGVWINSLGNIVAIRATPAEVIPALRQEAYWLFDAGAAWNNIMGSGLDLSAYVKNLADEEYTLGGIQLYTTIGISTKAFGEPRTYGMELRYKF